MNQVVINLKQIELEKTTSSRMLPPTSEVDQKGCVDW